MQLYYNKINRVGGPDRIIINEKQRTWKTHNRKVHRTKEKRLKERIIKNRPKPLRITNKNIRLHNQMSHLGSL